MTKRGFDVVVSLTVLTMTAPLILVISILIKLTSRGPILYRPLRTGRYGMAFRTTKFRTMVVNADTIGSQSTADDDPRVTCVGAFLRRWKLDELPQLVNVLKGDMSLVGPRPEVPGYTRLYTEEEKVALSVRPGITDYASIELMHLGQQLGEEEPERVYFERVWERKNQLRVRYAREHTFLKDLWIIWRSIIAAIKR